MALEPTNGLQQGVLTTADATGGVADPSDALVFTLLQNPEHGTLFLGSDALMTGATFTKFDIDNGLLSYEANESEPFSHDWAPGTPKWESGAPQPVDQANMTLPQHGEAAVNALESEAVNTNICIGWYRLGIDGEPTEPQFLWANAYVDGGTLLRGTTFTLGGLQEGEAFGLFVVRDGASEYRWLPEMVDAGAVFSFDAHGNLTAGKYVVSASRIFHTGDAALNPDGASHAVAGVDGARLMIGFSDLAPGGEGHAEALTVSIRYEGSTGLVESDSFSFVAKDGLDQFAFLDPADAGYTLADGEATFSITIDMASPDS